MVKRIFVEKRPGFNTPARQMLSDFRETFNLQNLESVRIFMRYDVEGLSDADFDKACVRVFGESNLDVLFEDLPPRLNMERTFAVEYLPGQFDQRADSAAQCCQLVTGKERPLIRTAKVISLKGLISDDDFEKIKSYVINPIETQEADFELPETLQDFVEEIPDVETLNDFNKFSDAELKNFLSECGFAMSFDDLKFCQKYFREEEKRPPTITELKVIDTYLTRASTAQKLKILTKNILNTEKNFTAILKKIFRLWTWEQLPPKFKRLKANSKTLMNLKKLTLAVSKLRRMLTGKMKIGLLCSKMKRTITLPKLNRSAARLLVLAAQFVTR